MTAWKVSMSGRASLAITPPAVGKSDVGQPRVFWYGRHEKHLIVTFLLQGSLDFRHEVRVLRSPLSLLHGFDNEIKPSVVEATAGESQVDASRVCGGEKLLNPINDGRFIVLIWHCESS